MSTTNKMLPFRQNQVVNKILQSGLSKTEFDFQSLGESRFELYYRPQPEYCFKVNQDHFLGVPGGDGRYQYKGRIKGWEGLLSSLSTWLTYLKENIEIGNPWLSAEVIELVDEVEQVDNNSRTLSDAEISYLHDRFDELESLAINQNLDVAQIGVDLEHLIEISKKVSIKDIILLLIGYSLTWLPNQQINDKIIQIISGFINYISELNSI